MGETVGASLQVRFPAATDAAFASFAANAELVPTVGVALARGHSVKLPKPHRAALEAGLVFAYSFQGLESLIRGAQMRVPGPLWAVLPDFWYVQMHAHIEAFVQLLEKAHILAAPTDETGWNDLIDRSKTWSRERLTSLAKGRATVAHANTYFARAVDEEGLWEPLLLVGAINTVSLEAMFKPEKWHRYELRVGQLSQAWSGAQLQMDSALQEAAQLLRDAQ